MRDREGHRVISKSPSRVRDIDEGAAGRDGREKSFPGEGKETENIELVARPAEQLS